MSKPRHVIRKVKNGRVKIFNRYFEVGTNDGRFEGNKYRFGIYWYCGEMSNKVTLMSTEAMQTAWNEERKNNASLNTDNPIFSDKFDNDYQQDCLLLSNDDHEFEWMFWHEVDTQPRESNPVW